jgi:IS1 family transposase
VLGYIFRIVDFCSNEGLVQLAHKLYVVVLGMNLAQLRPWHRRYARKIVCFIRSGFVFTYVHS